MAAPAPPEPEPTPQALQSIDLAELVLARLTIKDLASAAQVCCQFRAAAASAACDGVWRAAFVDEFGEAKAADYGPRQRTWRDKYIACLLDGTWQRLRSKARYLDELEDSAAVLERSAHSLLASLNTMDSTLVHRKHDLNALLADVAGRDGAHADSRRGRELLELAAAGGDLARCPRLTPDACASLLEMRKDVEFWRTSINEERDSLHRLWDSLSYVQASVKKTKADVAALQRRKATLEAATRYRPALRRASA